MGRVRKRIPIDQLQPGMQIVDLDRSWIETPFWRHRMRVAGASDIERLKAYGVRFVEVELGEQTDHAFKPSEADELEGTMDNLTEPPVSAESLVRPASDDAETPAEETATDARSFEEELPAARETYHAAKRIIRDTMHEVRLGRDINLEVVNRVVSAMADSLFRHADALTSLTRLKRFDEYTFYHSVNTAILALALGRRLHLNATALHRLGVGTLLHDIGKMRIPPEILNKPGRLNADEFELMKQHALRGAEFLAETTGLDETSVKPALEHHERVDGSGYPFGRKRAELSAFGMITAVVDMYDALTSDRCYHKAKPPHEVLRYLYLLGRRGQLHIGFVHRFIKVVGVYPVGSCVALNTGEIAVVSRLNHQQPLLPMVLIVKDSGGRRVGKPEPLDLATQTTKPLRVIETVLNPTHVGVEPNLVLDGGER